VPPRSFAAAGLIALAACGSDPDLDLTPYVIDTREPDGDERAWFVAFEGADGWESAPQLEPGVFELTPSRGTIAFTVICNESAFGGTSIVIEYDALGPERGLERPCWTDSRVDTPVVVAPANADIALRGGASFIRTEGPSRTALLSAWPGAQDVIAANDTVIVIRRGLGVPTAEPIAVDLEAAGVPLELPVLPIERPDQDETPTIYSAFTTAGGTRLFLRSRADFPRARAVPAAQTIEGDRHLLELQLVGEVSYRSVRATGPVFGDLAAHLVPEAEPLEVSASSEGPLALRWERALDGELRLDVEPFGDDGVVKSWTLIASPEWREATGNGASGRIRAPDLSTLDVWPAEWGLDRTYRDAVWDVSFSRRETRGDIQVFQSSSTDSFLSAPPLDEP
jgi:hypothetical protein